MGTNILQYILRFYKQMVEGQILFGQRVWGIDSRFPNKGVESWVAIYLSYSSGEASQTLPIDAYLGSSQL